MKSMQTLEEKTGIRSLVVEVFPSYLESLVSLLLFKSLLSSCEVEEGRCIYLSSSSLLIS